jgi:hypothetical protein
MAYLQIYKNRSNAFYTHSIWKGDDFYEVNLVPGEKMRWRYLGKRDPKVYQITATLIPKPSLKMITILQRVLQPTKNESVGDTFMGFKDWKSLNEGGNAIPESRSVTWEEARGTMDWVYKYVIPFLGLDKKDVDTIGSYGKKLEGDKHGDIDVAVSAEALMTKNALKEDDTVQFLANALAEKGLQIKINHGFCIVSFGAPINGDTTQGTCQIDLMITPDLEWSRFIYHSPDFKGNESKYKGKMRNILLMALITETQKDITKRTPDDGVEELETNILRYPKGIFRVRKNFMGKKGLVKNGKNDPNFDEFVTSNPQEVTELTVGEGYKPSDINTFEKLWAVIHSPNFKWKDKLQDILARFSECLQEQGLIFPSEAKEQYPKIFI